MGDRLPARLTPAEGRRFGWTLGTAFAVLAAVLWFKDHTGFGLIVAAAALLLAATATIAPVALGPVFRGWMRFGLALSKITTPIVLGALYFLVITPTGLLMRVFGRRPLSHRAVGGSYWKPHRAGGRSDLNRQF